MSMSDRTHGSVLRPLVVKSGAGPNDAERCVQALMVASTAAESGASTSLWLMGDAVNVAVPGVAETVVVDRAPDLSVLLSSLLELGTVTVCAQCAARRGLAAHDFVDGVRIAGAAAYVEEILTGDAQAVVY